MNKFMKKITILAIMLINMLGLTACVNTGADTSKTPGESKMTMEMELDKDYDDKDPFVNEKLFCVSEDLDELNADGTLKMDGEAIVLEVKNNKTKEVLWSKTWEGNVKSEPLSISLEKMSKAEEYVVTLTGTKINYAAIEITFDSNLVQERVKPS
ncbi:DUF4624 domain-containing lipoprotein [Blautia schinkii]|nr:DUF4624 domain-containing lipoprotein [Blautia schinkii]